MPAQPNVKRAIAFIDGQNLFYAAKAAFGYIYPNYDPLALAKAVCQSRAWQLTGTHFYTGVPNPRDNPDWNHFWIAKLGVMGTRGIRTYARRLRYRHETIRCPGGPAIACPDGSTVRYPGGNAVPALVAREKGIDIRLALDVVRMARENRYDVGLIFSQDQDLSEVVDEVRSISVQQSRWIKLACAYPVSALYDNERGINGAEWIRIDRASCDRCLDPNDYRLKPKTKPGG